MAFTKVRIDPATGASAEHWDLICINYNHRAQLSEMQFGVWVDKAAHDANLHPVHVEIFSVGSGLAPQLAAGALAFAMNYIKAQPGFEGAVDV